MITIIAAVAKNGAIGYENKLLYWLPNDLKRFKALTTGHTIIMGRRTFESLPNGALPNRRNVVVSRSVRGERREERENTTLEYFGSLEEALEHTSRDEEVFIIGGASVYEQSMAMADRLCLTEIDDVPKDADAFFPDYSKGWKVVRKEAHPKDERHAFEYAFVDYVRK
jgi:dihydrofolate reductase